MIEVDLEGLDHLQDVLDAVGKAGTEALGGALYSEATEVFNASQRIVPVQWGHLRDSGVVSTPVYDSDGVEVDVGYGGPAVDYALVVHEDLEAHHKAGKAAKYLERPALEATNGMGDRLADSVEKRVEKDVGRNA